MGVFGFLFGTVAKLDSHGLPYPLLVLVGMLPWQFFASVLFMAVATTLMASPLFEWVYGREARARGELGVLSSGAQRAPRADAVEDGT